MNLKPNRAVMQAAIEAAKSNQTPFGAALAMGNEVFVTAASQTKIKNDPTAHAVLIAIRNLADQLQKKDLSGFTLYSTCEPCPMCTSAVMLAGIKSVVFGCGIPVVSWYLNQMNMRAGEVISANSIEVELINGFMEAECEILLQKYS